MDYRKQVIERLRNLNEERAALINLPEQIKALEMQFTALRAVRTDSEPVKGGTNHREDALISNIAEREERVADLEWTKHEVAILERNIAALKPNEQRALDLFYIYAERQAAERLAEELGYSVAQVHRIKTAAVENLARRLYGWVKI